MSKSTIFLVFVLGSLAVASGSPGFWGSSYAYTNGSSSHNLTVGARQLGDYLIRQEHVKKDSSFWRKVTAEKTFLVNKYERITQVKAIDQKKDGHGGTASILNGGPGFNSVSLRFKSERGYDIDFIVEIYARR